MDERKQRLLEKQTRRYDLLLKFYDEVGGSETKLVDFPNFAQGHGFSYQEMEDALNYFLGEHLLESVSDEGLVHLSHRGIVEIEQSLTQPDKPTDHFPVQVIQQHFHGAVGAVQNAPHSIANVNQNIGPNVGELISLLGELRTQFQGLPSEKKDEALQLIDGLEAEAKTEGRSVARLRAFYNALLPFVTDVGAQVLATLIAKQLGF